MTEPWEVMNLILERRGGGRPRFVTLSALTIQEWAAAVAHWDRRKVDRRARWRPSSTDRRRAA